MSDDILCCADARLDGQTLTGRQAGGSVWTLDLGQVTAASYIEWRGRRTRRHVLWLKGPEGWRQVSVRTDLLRMSVSRDLSEHRALSARVAEVLAEFRPGFRISYEVRRTAEARALSLALGGLALVLSAGVVWALSGQAEMALALLATVAVAMSLAWLGRARAKLARPNVSAAALPGILTAVSRRG